MKFRKLLWLTVVTILAVTLSSCNLSATPVPTPDVGVIQTQAFNLVLTQVVLQSSPTPLPTNTALPSPTLAPPPTFAPVGGGINTATPFPFSSPLPGLGITPLASPVPTIGIYSTTTTKNGCNDGVMTAESEPFDDDIMSRGNIFDKWFQFVNTGSCTWDEGYTFAFLPEFSTPGFKGADIVIKKPEEFVKTGQSVSFKFTLNSGPVPGTFQGTWKMKDDAGNFFGSMVHVRYIVK